MSDENNVIEFRRLNNNEQQQEEPTPDQILERAVGAYKKVLIIGYNHDGELDVRATWNFEQTEINFAIDLFKHRLMNGNYWE